MEQTSASKETRSIKRLMRVRGRDGLLALVIEDIPAANAADAARIAKQRGIEPIEIEEVVKGSRAAASSTHNFSLLLFSQELLALLEAGLNLNEALQVLHTKERVEPIKVLLERMKVSLAEGRSFSDVLEDFPEMIPQVFVASVRAAERTGDLTRALSRYITYQIQFDDIRKKILSASIYPLALLVVGSFVTIFLLGYVLPRFSVVYNGTGRDIPWMSLKLLELGMVIKQHWRLLGLAGSVTVLCMVAAVRRRRFRTALLNSVLRLPWLSERAADFRLIRFYRAASLLMASGIALPRALAMVEGLLDASQQKRLVQARRSVDEGQSLSSAMTNAGLTSAVAESLIKVGERSGQMADMLERIAKFHEEEMSRTIDWASRLLEPVLMAMIGVIVGAVVLLMYMPIFELAGSLQ